MYFTAHVPSPLSVQLSLDSDGPSMAKLKPPAPAPFVSTVNSAGRSTSPFSKPGPKALHFEASVGGKTSTWIERKLSSEGWKILYLFIYLLLLFKISRQEERVLP